MDHMPSHILSLLFIESFTASLARLDPGNQKVAKQTVSDLQLSYPLFNHRVDSSFDQGSCIRIFSG